MEGESKNTQTLRDAGLLEGELPAEYESFIDGLSTATIAHSSRSSRPLRRKT